VDPTRESRPQGAAIRTDEVPDSVPPFQVMPPLSDEEYAKLRDEIAANGVLVPIVKDQHGNILDGHHRSRIAEELGIAYRVDVVRVDDAEHARSLARTYNLARRHLTREQKRGLIAEEIEANPNRSDREIARLMGCDHKTVGSIRRELSGEIPHHRDPEPAAELADPFAQPDEFRHADWRSLQPHPANALLPDMTDRELADLAESVYRFGLIQAVVLDGAGRVVDGRQRLRACAKAGVAPRFRRLGEHYTEERIISYVISANLIRQQLSMDQRAAIEVQREEFYRLAKDRP
jgi:ParB-like chromosome segregation protein Spo0J